MYSFVGVNNNILYCDYKGKFWLYDMDNKRREFMKSSHTSSVFDFLRRDNSS